MRLRNRDLYKTLDLRVFGEDEGRQTQWARRIDREFKAKIAAGTVIRDADAAISIYTQIGGDDEKVQILDSFTIDFGSTPRVSATHPDVSIKKYKQRVGSYTLLATSCELAHFRR